MEIVIQDFFNSKHYEFYQRGILILPEIEQYVMDSNGKYAQSYRLYTNLCSVHFFIGTQTCRTLTLI